MSFLLKLDVMILFRFGANYRKFAETKKLDWCETVSKLHTTKNAFIKKFFKDLKTLAPNVFRGCPVNGRYAVKKFVLSKSYVNMIPIGGYALKVEGSDGGPKPTRFVVFFSFDIEND